MSRHKLVVKQWGRGQYELPFLKAVVQRVVDKMPGADQLNLAVEFRERGSVRHVLGLTHRGEPIQMNKKQLGGVKGLCNTLAHEICHHLQYARGELWFAMQGGVSGKMWEGEFWPEATPYREQPWEIEAERAGDHYGALAFAELNREGLLPLSRQEQFDVAERQRRERENDSPTFGDLAVFSDEEQTEILRKLRSHEMTHTEFWGLIRARAFTPNAAMATRASPMTRAAVEALAVQLGVAIEYESAVQDWPAEVRMDAPDGYTFDGEAHQIVRHSWRAAGQALREFPLVECDDPDCEWCEG